MFGPHSGNTKLSENWTFASQVRGRGLRSRARFKQDQTLQDWGAIPALAGPGQDYFFMAQENPGIKCYTRLIELKWILLGKLVTKIL